MVNLFSFLLQVGPNRGASESRNKSKEQKVFLWRGAPTKLGSEKKTEKSESLKDEKHQKNDTEISI